MKPHDIGKAYNQITHLWDTEGFNRNNGIDHHKRTIAVVKNKGKALDVGCGCTGRFVDLLLSEGFSAEGVDVSNFMIAIDTNILFGFCLNPWITITQNGKLTQLKQLLIRQTKFLFFRFKKRG